MKIILILALFSLQSCATHMQDKIGEEFKSIQPDYSNFENINNATEGQYMTATVDFSLLTEELIESEILLQLLGRNFNSSKFWI